MRRRLPVCLVVFLALSGATAFTGTPAKPETPFEKAKRLAVSKEKKDRVQAFRWFKALGKPGTARGDEALLRYAELCLRFHAEGQKGTLAEAKRAFMELKDKAGSRWGLRGRIGLYRVAAAGGRRKDAIAGLDRFLSRQTKCERAVEAAYYLGCVYAGESKDLKQLKLARVSLGYALKLHEAVKRYHTAIVSPGTIRGKLNWVNRRIREIEAGRLKTAFAAAERKRKAKKYDEAVKMFAAIVKEFPGEDLAELSGLRIPQCHFWKKDFKTAILKARAFVAENPLGPYRGHAHLLMGDIFLERLFDIRSAEPEFRCILAPVKARPRWVEAAHRHVLACRKREKDALPLAGKPGKTWKEVHHQAHERVGILEYVHRRYEKAAEHFETSQKLCPSKLFGSDPHQGMAQLAGKIRRKEDVIPRILLAEKAVRPKLVLLLASLYIAGWRDDRALKLFQRVSKGEFKEASVNQKAYARMMEAEAWFQKRQDKKALACLRDFDKPPYSRTPFAPEATLHCSVVLSRLNKWKESDKYMRKCYTLYPNTKEGEYAFYQMAFTHYVNGDPQVALRFYRDFQLRYPSSYYVKKGHVKSFITACNWKIEKKRKEEQEKR